MARQAYFHCSRQKTKAAKLVDENMDMSPGNSDDNSADMVSDILKDMGEELSSLQILYTALMRDQEDSFRRGNLPLHGTAGQNPVNVYQGMASISSRQREIQN